MAVEVQVEEVTEVATPSSAAVRPQLATDRGPALSSGNGLDPARHCRPWSIERQRPGWAWGLLLLPRAAQKPHISQREAFYAPIFSSQEISHLHHAGRLVKPIHFTILYSQGLVKDVGVVARRWVGVCIQIRVRVSVGGRGGSGSSRFGLKTSEPPHTKPRLKATHT